MMAARLARALHARLELIHVAHLPPGWFPELVTEDLVDDLRAAAERKIEASAAPLRAAGTDVVTGVRVGLVDDQILQRAVDLAPEILVLGSHARQGLSRAFLGSVAERAVRFAPCPVLIVPSSRVAAVAPAAVVAAPRGPAADRPLEILVAVDLSAATDAALAWLHHFRERVPCKLRLVHVYRPMQAHERLGLEPPANRDADP